MHDKWREKKMKYPANVCEFCLQLSYISQRAYEFVRGTFNNNLPAKCTIRAWYANSDFSSSPGVNHKALESLEMKVAEKKVMGEELICSLCVDEMSIRQHVQWCGSQKILLGYPTYGDNDTTNDLKCAKQAIVFMLCGVNERFQLPFAYHFASSIDGKQRAKLLEDIYVEISKTGIILLNITSDGLYANDRMYVELGANLNPEENDHKPFVEFKDGHKPFVIKDAPHMLKLVRNTIGSKKHLMDGAGNDIKWSTWEKLVEFGKSNNFGLTHKLNRTHIQWGRNIMNVALAVQTLSASFARSIEILMNAKIPGFEKVDGEIRFAKTFNDLFDIFNTKSDKSDNPNVLKRALCPQNREQIFKFFDDTIEYIKNLKLVDADSGEIKPILGSRNQAGFRGMNKCHKAIKP